SCRRLDDSAESRSGTPETDAAEGLSVSDAPGRSKECDMGYGRGASNTWHAIHGSGLAVPVGPRLHARGTRATTTVHRSTARAHDGSGRISWIATAAHFVSGSGAAHVDRFAKLRTRGRNPAIHRA